VFHISSNINSVPITTNQIDVEVTVEQQLDWGTFLG